MTGAPTCARIVRIVFLRALIAFLALPGVVALVIPFILGARELHDGREVAAIGLLPLSIGFALLLWCVRDFYVAGKGTLAPWSPPRHLVTRGAISVQPQSHVRRGHHDACGVGGLSSGRRRSRSIPEV